MNFPTLNLLFANNILSFFTLFYKAYIHLLLMFYYWFNWIIFLKICFFQFQVRIIGTIFPILEHCAPFPPSILWNRKSKKEDVSSIISLNSRNTQPRYQSQDFQIAKSTLSRNIVGRLMRKKVWLMTSDRSKCRFIFQDIFLNIMEHDVVPKELQQTTNRFLFSHHFIFKAKKSTVERKLIISFKILLLNFSFERLKEQSKSIFFLSFFTLFFYIRTYLEKIL